MIDSKKVVTTPTLVLFSVRKLIWMPADYRSLNFENPTKSGRATASQSDLDFINVAEFAPIQNGGEKP